MFKKNYTACLRVFKFFKFSIIFLDYISALSLYYLFSFPGSQESLTLKGKIHFNILLFYLILI